MRIHRLIPFLLLITSACAPAPEVQYCNRMGTGPGSPEYANCTTYFFQQQDVFNVDRAQCEQKANLVYPPSLYSQGTWAMGFDPWGRPDMIPIDPDWQHNHELDELRMSRIIQPCMQAKGWNSGVTWQAGRHAVSRASAHHAKPAASAPAAPVLPWQ